MLILSFDVGIVNLAYCVFDSSENKIKEWEVITLNNDRDYSGLYINLIKQLDTRPHLLSGIHTVLIEKQPSFNPKMRIIAGCLQSYFYIRGVVDQTSNTAISSIRFFSPKNKLKCYSGPELDIVGKSKSKYSQTKKMGIVICRKKLEEHRDSIEIKELFEKSPKKDDLADCYLQALTYSMYGNTFSKNTNKPKCKNISKTTKKDLKTNVKIFMDSYIHPQDILEYFNNFTFKTEIEESYGMKIHNIEDITLLFKKMSMVNYLKRKIIL